MIDLESYLIPAEESLSDDAKSSLLGIGVMTLICVALGITSKLKENKQHKIDKANAVRANREHENRMKIAFQRVDQKSICLGCLF